MRERNSSLGDQGVAEWIFALPDGLVGYSSVDYDAIGQLRW